METDQKTPLHEEFRNWLVENSEKIEEIKKIYGRTKLKEISEGKKGIESINPGKRLKLYELTKMPQFNFEYEIHPNQFDINELVKGNQKIDLLIFRMDYDGTSKTQLADEIGVHPDTFSKYLSGKKISGNYKRQIEEKLIGIYATSQEEPAIDKKQLPIDQKIKSTRESLHPTLDQRVGAINEAIELIAEQSEYFRNAEEGERKILADSLNLDDWVYSHNILTRIDQSSGPETILRNYARPKGGNK